MEKLVMKYSKIATTLTFGMAMSAVAASANATVISFDSSFTFVDNLVHTVGDPISVQGFTFADNHTLAVYGTLNSNFDGKVGLFDGTVGGAITVTMTAAGGGPFKLNLNEFAKLNPGGKIPNNLTRHLQ